jgi:hypoxanthine phosphoribosyltransferase
LPYSKPKADTQTQIHKLCQEAADQILNDFKPNLMIAIGGGGYVPARILRYDIPCVAPTP